MRTLKFRQFVKGRFHYWGFLEPDSFVGPINPQDPSQQFTGLFSKDGKEIWEGDITQTVCKDGTGLSVFRVFWDNRTARFRKIRDDGEIYDMDEWSELHKQVIGNIYENPELLEVTPPARVEAGE